MPRHSRTLVCFRLGREHYDIAIDNYRRAAAIDSNLPGLQLNLGLALFKAAQFPAAIESFSSELIKHPDDQRLTILLGMAPLRHERFPGGHSYLKRAADRDPQSLTLRMTLMQSLPGQQAVSMRSQHAAGDSESQW